MTATADTGHAGGGFVGALRDRIVASDPAFSRMRFASRAVLSMLTSALLLTAFTLLVQPLPLVTYGLALILSFIGSTAVRDATARAQLLTRFFAGLSAAAAVFVAGLLAPRPVTDDIVFLVVIFVAVYVRRFGVRWFAVGTIAFMAYFMGEYLHPRPSDIGWIALSIVMALTVTHIVSVYILHDDAERDFRRALTTIDRRINLILRALVQASDGHALTPGDHKALLAQVTQMREAVLMAEGFLPQGDDGALATEGPAAEIALALFQLQIAVERLVRTRRNIPAEIGDAAALRAGLERDEPALQGERARLKGRPSDEDTVPRLLLRLHRARLRLEEALGPQPSPAFAQPGGKAGGLAAVISPAPKADGGMVPVALRLPIQVTLACGLAMGIGVAVSSARWYWAVIAAFIVFNNTRSRADTAMRALSRSMGTFGGIIAGTVLATLLHGQTVAMLALLPPVFFLAFFFLQASYSLMIFFLTVALALLYGLMGMFAPGLLILRLEETVIGSLAGAAAAFFVFPVRASTGVGAALETYFDGLEALVAATGKRARGEGDGSGLAALSRTLDQRYTELATAARPLGGPWSAVTRFGQVRQRLLLLAGCAYWSRVLVRGLRPEEQLDTATAERMTALADDILQKIAVLREAKVSFFERPPRLRETDDRRPPAPLPVSAQEGPVFSLEVISILLDRALRRMGKSTEPQEAAT